jgi:hypothetical protein
MKLQFGMRKYKSEDNKAIENAKGLKMLRGNTWEGK